MAIVLPWKVKLREESINFVVDTGVNISIISPDLVKHPKLEKSLQVTMVLKAGLIEATMTVGPPRAKKATKTVREQTFLKAFASGPSVLTGLQIV